MEKELTLYDLMTAPVDPKGVYYNTVNLEGKELKKRQMKAGTQNAIILELFRNQPGTLFTPFDVYRAIGAPDHNAPITSIRRAITSLTDQGYLVKTEIKRMGGYNELCYCWTLKK